VGVKPRFLRNIKIKFSLRRKKGRRTQSSLYIYDSCNARFLKGEIKEKMLSMRGRAILLKKKEQKKEESCISKY
jgi:hypothetical protein